MDALPVLKGCIQSQQARMGYVAVQLYLLGYLEMFTEPSTPFTCLCLLGDHLRFYGREICVICRV